MTNIGSMVNMAEYTTHIEKIYAIDEVSIIINEVLTVYLVSLSSHDFVDFFHTYTFNC